MEALPPDQAAPSWQMVQAQAMKSKGIQYLGNHCRSNLKISAVEKNCVRQHQDGNADDGRDDGLHHALFAYRFRKKLI
jgi:hypothetical protein